MKLAVVNESTIIANVDVRAATEAVRTQVRRDLAPAWGLVPPHVRFFPHLAEVPPDWCVVTILDDPDQAFAAGYHDETPDGRPYGRVFARVMLDAGDTPLRGVESVSAILSHEACEPIVDPSCNLWADDSRGVSWAVEVSDPVQATIYSIGGIDVSDFVFPAFFDAHPERGAQFSHMDAVGAPFSLAPGGYAVTRTAGRTREVYGAKLRPHKLHPGGRSMRRLGLRVQDEARAMA